MASERSEPSDLIAPTPAPVGAAGQTGRAPTAGRSSLIRELPSIVEPLDLGQLFPKAQPLEVELGCGDGSFLVAYAAMHPERNFIGVERLLGRIQKLSRKGIRAALTNLAGIRIESRYFLQYLLAKHTVAALHIYFPDPWPKRKHASNRLINDDFPILARAVLQPGGMIYLRTDDQSYFEQMIETFAAAPEFRQVDTPADLAAILTDFEKDFQARGISTLSAAFQAGNTHTIGLEP